MRCLQKKPDERWQRAEDMLAVLDGATAVEANTPARHGVTRARQRWRFVAAGLVAAVGLTAGWYALTVTRDRGSLAVGQIMRVTTEPGLELDPAVSPDGLAVAYAAGVPGK